MATKKPKNTPLQKVWSSLIIILSKLYKIFCDILISIYHVLKLIFQLLKTFLFGISSFIAANALMILAISLSVYLLSSAIGLPESTAFQNRRDDFITTQFEWFDEFLITKKASREAKKQGYKLKELTEVSCNEATNCATPDEYLIQSNCPYTSLCLQDRCAVVCPKEFRH